MLESKFDGMKTSFNKIKIRSLGVACLLMSFTDVLNNTMLLSGQQQQPPTVHFAGTEIKWTYISGTDEVGANERQFSTYLRRPQPHPFPSCLPSPVAMLY